MGMRKAGIAAFLGLLMAQSLQVGQEVPGSVSLSDEQGKVVRFADLRGKWIVLYFYPHDDTPGCTQQGKEFSRLLPDFEKLNAQVYGISTQDAASHRAFKQKHGIRVPLLVDEEGKTAELFGVKRFMGMCSRDVVIINPEGKVANIRRGVSPATSAKEVLAFLQQQKK
uniref:thioredoxin-dependent peroxiredoxin n=1 Tax=uncultured Bacteroidota bacterium TaxID=152509 RepID=H5SGJ3_9BACT|nr:peroxiredoxin Q/BCP [uncultured Bacteroidetes bacterium]